MKRENQIFANLFNYIKNELNRTISNKQPVAFEWWNPLTGHCYVDYTSHLGQDEKDGYIKYPLYK